MSFHAESLPTAAYEVLDPRWHSTAAMMDEVVEQQHLCTDEAGCDLWGPPPPIFDIPPPPRPPWEPCPDDEIRRPLTASDEAATNDLGGSGNFNYETCDINPLVIDSTLYVGESLFTVLLIVICSLILVGIVMAVAIVIYRRRSMFRRLYSDGSKSIPSLPSLPAAPSTTSPRTMFSRQPRPENGSERPNPFLSHFLTASKASSNDMEMTEDCRHVYSNPNYPMHERGPSGLNGLNDFNGFNNTMQIGGLPFYLPPQNSTKPINQLVESSAEAASTGFEAQNDVHVYEDGSSHLEWYQPHQSPHPGLRLPPRPAARMPPPQQQVAAAVNNGVAAANLAGPIYEDIDRMCSYRGYPPELLRPPPQTTTTNGDPPDYYNLTNNSGGSSPRNKSSNSDGSFEGTSTRLRTMSPSSVSSTHRSPQSVYSARLANRPSGSSVYYYSDTLRKGRVGSDSGISVDTPPPRMQCRGRQGRTSNGGPIVQTEVVLNDGGCSTGGHHRKPLKRNDTKV